MADQPLSEVVHTLIERMREPLGLDRWQVKIEFAAGENTASCSAMPEYRICTISLDPDRLQTGDELDEILAHELCHTMTWPISAVADDLVILVAESVPEPWIAPLAKFLKEQVRLAEEIATTDVGRACVGLLRKVWKTEAELKAAQAEIRALRKAAKDAAA